MKEKIKRLFAIGFIGLTTLGAGAGMVSAFGYGTGIFEKPLVMNSDVSKAIENNDFDAFKDSLDNSGELRSQFNSMDWYEQEHEAIQEAIENNDYQAYVDIISTDNLTHEVVTEDDFSQMVAQHKAHDAIEQAIENNDYDSWVAALEDLPFGQNMIDIVSEDEFSDYVEMHNLAKEGDFESAQEIAKEIGLDSSMSEGFEERPFSHSRNHHGNFDIFNDLA